MFKKEITYTDYNGVKRTENFYFNLSRPKLMSMSKLFTEFEQASKVNDNDTMAKLFVEIILKAYGEKSEDGIHFRQNEQISNDFANTEAFNVLFTELTSDPNALQSFFRALIPNDLQNAASLPTV